MRILEINKFYFEGRGAETVFLDTVKLLEENGHQVAVFAMQDDKNLPSAYSRYFVPSVNTKKIGWHLLKSFYSRQSAERLQKLIADFKPEVAHLHNIYHQISPSVLPVLKKHNIPVVMTAHDYKLVCPSYHLNAKRTCPKNIFLHALHCLVFRSHKNSFFASAIVAFEWLVFKLARVYEKNVDMVLAPSQYVKDRLIEYGWPSQKVTVVPHFVESAKIESRSGKYVLFVGDDSYEKGFDIFVEVAKQMPEAQFAAAGDIKATKDLPANIKLLGLKPRAEMPDVYAGASAVLVPSRANETFGLVAIEAARQGVPSVVSDRGALPEVAGGQYVFKAGQASQAAALLRRAIAEKGGSTPRFDKYTAQAHLARIMAVFSDLITKNHIK